jgi:rare lipoprotein A
MFKIIISVLLFTVQANAETVKQKGIASWYGKENKKSSTGKALHAKIPAVAHKHLPIGTKVKIVAVKTKKEVIAVVEDRGPYVKGRIVDLNYIAAKQLGILESGLAMVTLEKLSND